LKTIAQRSTDAFGDDDRTEADAYLEMVSSSWKDIAQAMNRCALLVLGFMALFELLIAQKSLDKLEIGSFTFTNISVLQIAIPVIVACSLFNLIYLGQRWLDHQAVYYSVTRRFYPRMARNNLAFLIRPQVSAFLRVGAGVPAPENMRRSDWFADWVITVFSVLIIALLPAAFEIQAYVHLFTVYGTSNAVLWVSLVTGSILMCCNYIFLWLTSNALLRENLPYMQDPATSTNLGRWFAEKLKSK
jgi:hypothetical protein